MRIVLDVNILARVVMSPQGPAAELFDRLRSGHLLVSSVEMLADLSRVLAYERVRRIHQLDDRGIEEFVARIEEGSLVVALPQSIPAVVPADPDDDVVIATAVIGRAEVLCTRDGHLRAPEVRAYCSNRGIRVMTDVELLKELCAQGRPAED